jgi:type II secretory pathway pseudopilin PulG
MKFSLTTIAYVFALLAAGMAAFGVPLGVVASLFVLGYWRWNPRWPGALVELLVVILVIGMLLGLLMPTVQSPRERSRVMACGSNMQSIALALRAYQRTQGRLPAAGDEESRTMSWRVAILPWLENRNIYEAYDGAEAWNSGANAKATSQALPIYECPSDLPMTLGAPQTNYFAIVDTRTMWGGGEPQAFKDPPGKTILLIEAAGLSVPWAEPRDLSFDEALAILTGKAPNQVMHVRTPQQGFYQKGYGQAGVHVAFANGRVGFVPEGISPKLARALLTANGGEEIAQAEINRLLLPQADKVNWLAIVWFAVLALLPGLMRVARRMKSNEGSPAS